MPDPIQVERAFQEVIAHFESTPSIRHRYTLFRDFIESLEGSFKKYETYIIQLLDELPVYGGASTWSGIDPEQIELDISLLNTLNRELQLSDKTKNYRKVTERLAEICLLLYACLGDLQDANHYLKKLYGIAGFDEANEEGDVTEPYSLDQLYKCISFKLENPGNLDKDQEKKLRKFQDEIHKLLQKENWKVLIPVAEVYKQGGADSEAYGRLRKLTVELYGEAKEKDSLIWNMNVYGAEKPSITNQQDFLVAVRQLFKSNTTKRTAKFFKGGVRFELSNAVHEGNSANLAIAMLWYTQLFRASGQRERYRISSQVAVTGDISSDGSVLPVESQTIHLKARAAFFSWAKTLVVPASQSPMFQKELQDLQKKYPHRKLYLIGVHQLQEVFFDRRIAGHEIQGRLKYYFNQMRNESARTTLIPVVIVLLLIIARLVYGPVDRNAVALEFIDNHIALKNKSGNVIQRIDSNEPTRLSHSVSKPNAILYDLTGDGKNELIYGNRSVRGEEGSPKVQIWSITGDSLIWEKDLTLNYEFPRQNTPLISELRPLEIDIANTSSGERIVVHTGSTQYFQAVIFVFNAHNGELISEYIHTGQIRDMMVMDMNNDDEDEIILTGVNNAFWNAFVALLDANDAHGHSPATPDYQPAGIERANELVYARIPKTIIGKYVEFLDKYNQGRIMFFDDTSDILTILIVEGWRYFNDLENFVETVLYFDRSMMLVGVGTSDIYDVVAKELYEEGEIKEIPDFDYFESYQDSILYWTGAEFITTQEYFQTE